MKTMSYRPKEVRRTYIPKTGSKELRPLGIPTYEDKLFQLHKQLCRRSQKGNITWRKFYKILEYNPIVEPKIYHSMWQ